MYDENNRAEFVGTIGEDMRISHKVSNCTFYDVVLHVKRISGIIDKIPLIVREKILKQCEVSKGSKISVKGELQSRAEWDPKRRKSHMRMYVQVTEMKVVSDDEKDKNEVFLSGTMCGEPNLRRTPKGKDIVDFSIISWLKNAKSYRVWCIAWHKMAYSINEKKNKEPLTFLGKFQSREYTKRWGDGEEEQKLVYEISVVELIE